MSDKPDNVTPIASARSSATAQKLGRRKSTTTSAATLLEQHDHLGQAYQRLVDGIRLVEICWMALRNPDSYAEPVAATLGLEVDAALDEARQLLMQGRIK